MKVSALPAVLSLPLLVGLLLHHHPVSSFSFLPVGSISPISRSPFLTRRYSTDGDGDDNSSGGSYIGNLLNSPSSPQERESKEATTASEDLQVADVEQSNKPLYDDEYALEEVENLSNSMKDRLLKEAQGLGADPNAKSEPLILYISAVVAVLVIVGGKGILY